VVSSNENRLIEALYDAALGYRSWGDVSHSLMRHIGGQTLMFSTQHLRTSQVDVHGWLNLGSRALQEYAQFAPHDVWVNGYVERRLFGQAIVGSAVVPEPVLKRSFIYNEYLRPRNVDIYHLVGTAIPMDGGFQAALGIHRPMDAGDFTPADAKAIQRLVPHLQRALEVRRRLQHAEQANRSLHSVFDRLSLGVVMLGSTGRLLHVNAAADLILHRADGLIRTPDGLRAARKEDDKRLQALIGGLRHPSNDGRSAGGHMRIQRSSGQSAYAVMLAPAGPRVFGDDRSMPAILLFISDPGAKIVSDLAVLSELFGFTPAEGRLVLALLSGIAPPEFARKAGITYNTAKALLSRAMARTDTRSQLELVLLVAGSLGAMTTSTPRTNPSETTAR
jgi:DNA-binding CsgD family transcriptional regulator/PAS domain-containing protein